MTISELIDQLQTMVDDEGLDPDTEVRLMTQPNYPLQANLASVCLLSEVTEANGAECVYLVEGASQGYGHSGAWG